MKRKLLYITCLIIIISFGPAILTGLIATIKAKKIANGDFCWIERISVNKSNEWGIVTTKNFFAPYKFWIFNHDMDAIFIRPYFGVVVKKNNLWIGYKWNFGQMDFNEMGFFEAHEKNGNPCPYLSWQY